MGNALSQCLDDGMEMVPCDYCDPATGICRDCNGAGGEIKEVTVVRTEMKKVKDETTGETTEVRVMSLKPSEEWDGNLPAEVQVTERTMGERVAEDADMAEGLSTLPPGRPQDLFEWRGNWALLTSA